MRQVRAWLLRLAGLFARDRRDRELADEIESHLQLHIEDNLRRGMTAEQARRAALINLGGVESAKELYRDRRGLPLVETLFQDLRFGARMLRKSPGFTLTAVLALALGIGANTAVFSVIDGVLLKPLGFKDPNKLVRIWEKMALIDHGAVAYPNLVDWQDQNSSFDQMACYREAAYNLTGGEMPERVTGRQVSANFFSTLGVTPAMGRDFRPEDDRPGASPVAMISDALWTRRFARDPSIVGKTITLDLESYVVVAVLAPRFHFYWSADVYVPLHAKNDPYLASRVIHLGGQVVGRLKPGVSMAQARADMEVIAGRLGEQYPETNKDHSVALASLFDDIVGDARHLLLILLSAVAFVLLIACANVANLMLARAATRHKEIAIRSALGASSFRIARLLITEGLVLAVIGGALGLLIAYWGTSAALAALPKVLPRAADIAIDPAVLLFTMAASILTGLIFGLAPALQASKTHSGETLKEGGRAGSPGRLRTRNALVVAEIALALILLVGSGLLIRSFALLHKVNPGFDPENVLSLQLSVSPRGFSDSSKTREFYREFLDRTRSLPGVQAAAATSLIPLGGYGFDVPFYINGRPVPAPSDLPLAMSLTAGPGYLDAMRIPLLKGRFFDDRDNPKSPLVAVIDEDLAAEYFPGDDPVGRHITIQGGKDFAIDMQIIGVVGHVKQENLDTDAGAGVRFQLYTTFDQAPDQALAFFRGMGVVVRTKSDPASYISAIRSQLGVLAPDQVMYAARPMQEVVSESISNRRFVLLLLGTFSLLALALSSMGIYGVMSYSVTQRRHEIGIRMALGASRARMLRIVLGNGIKLAAIGIGLGAAGAIILTRFMSGFLYGVSPTDPLTFVAISLFLSGVALLASYIPARRATGIDPMTALRNG